MCEIVKAWVGTMDNTYYYCRDHKVECPTEHTCASQAPKTLAATIPVNAAKSPWWVITNLRPGMYVVATDTIPGHVTAHKRYEIMAVHLHSEQVSILADLSTVVVHVMDLRQYFKPYSIGGGHDWDPATDICRGCGMDVSYFIGMGSPYCAAQSTLVKAHKFFGGPQCLNCGCYQGSIASLNDCI